MAAASTTRSCLAWGRMRRVVRAGAVAVATLAAPGTAVADKISHPTAVFEGLDKITGRTISFEVAINETVQFGTLQIVPRVCYSRPPTEPPQTDAFAQVDQVDETKTLKRIFSGWMFADSPGLHGVEHPIYDIWLTGCKGGAAIIHDAPETEATALAPDDNTPPDAAIDPNAPKTPVAAPPKKHRPKPKVVAAPAPDNGAPLDLGAGPAQGNARTGR